MKWLLLVFVAFVAAEPEAESDPLLYINRPYYSTYSSYAPYRYNHYNTYSSLYSPYSPYYHRYFKREAEADSEADPLLYINRPYYNAYSSLYSPYRYNYYNTYSNLYSPYYHRYVKREAEAEADPNLVYTNANGFHTNLANIQKGIHHNQAYVPGSVYKTISPITTPHVYSSYKMPYTTYTTTPYMYNPYRLYKREAEGESDPYVISPYAFNRFPYYNTYSSLYTRPYTSYYSNFYNRYPYY